ncbi:MAG TPA: ABA4-like family protein [Pseudomonadales bacterium]|nr:ABA4-like family protein [Pseudomonadales bacterium]
MQDTIFSICGNLAMLGWLGLVFLPGQRVVVEVIARIAIPVTIGVLYVFLMATNYQSAPPGAGYGSLDAVASLFTVRSLLLAGWIHYLAFDLFVGSWEVSDARANGIHHLWVIPCLFATFMVGPAGLALYFLVKLAYRLIGTRPAEQTA